jgi:Fe-S-cluster-containing dehydrogenase component
MADVAQAPIPAGVPAQENLHKWGMVIDIDLCTGCQACVVACQAENNIPINTEDNFVRHRANEWIRIERYWEGEFPDIKARFIPVMCQHCGNAPCEPVCPVYAIQHNSEGLNVQTYNRCVGTRYCGNNCPYTVRVFNWAPPQWPESMNAQLNPDVTVRTQGLIEKCSMCLHRINRAKREESRNGRPMADGDMQTACAQACPTSAIIFGDWKDQNSRINRLAKTGTRAYHMLAQLGTEPNVVYLKKVDPNYTEAATHEAPANQSGRTASRSLPVING